MSAKDVAKEKTLQMQYFVFITTLFAKSLTTTTPAPITNPLPTLPVATLEADLYNCDLKESEKRMNDFNFRVFIIMRAPQKWYNIKGIN